MKAKMYSQKDHSYLFDHVLDGFASSHDGIEQLRDSGLIGDDEYADLLKKNSSRLIDRIKEFKIIRGVTCVAFAVMFTWMQATGDQLEMRRARTGRIRTRTEQARRKETT
jgi:hypothetical protein